MNIHSIHRAVFHRAGFRERRHQLFRQRLQPREETTVIDVGGVPDPWNDADPLPEVTLLNIDPYLEVRPRHPRIRTCAASALDIPFPDGHFEIAFSNSVIEHVGSWENQQRFAAEVRRVGRGIWVQTPAREFFLEPHLLTPFIHWLPNSLRGRLLRNGTVWGWLVRPTPEQVRGFLDEVRLLSYEEMRQLFPDCELFVERFLGMPKSYVAIRVGSQEGRPGPGLVPAHAAV